MKRGKIGSERRGHKRRELEGREENVGKKIKERTGKRKSKEKGALREWKKGRKGKGER